MKQPTRRTALHRIAVGLGLLAGGPSLGCALSLEDGLMNPCRPRTPEARLGERLVREAFEGVEAGEVWDAHVHLLGLGDGGSGAWVNPARQAWSDPVSKLQGMFYKNAACAEVEGQVDAMFIHRLHGLLEELPAGVKAMIFAFDQAHDGEGQALPEQSTFFIPNLWAYRIARTWPERFAWVASVHPWRRDAVEAVEEVVKHGAVAMKWLPASMNIDPSSPLCDPYYDALAAAGLPLITHAGTERALVADEEQDLANPLRLRRALGRGVKVVMAHCASLGECPDLDEGPSGPLVPCFELFARMMDEPAWRELLLADISGLTQTNRAGLPLQTTLEREDWHRRLVWGSDYPLAGVVPLTSLSGLIAGGHLTDNEAEALHTLRLSNPILFDFVLKRTVRVGEARYGREVFETRRVFGRSG